MDQNVKTKWVTALRSGSYGQTAGALKSEEGNYCCLGVLCDLYQQETGEGEWTKEYQFSRFEFEVHGEMSDGMPTVDVYEWAGIDFYQDELTGTHPSRLANLNDNGAPFAEIADVIERDF